MKGEVKKESELLESRIERLEIFVVPAAVLVVFGLFVESWPDIWASITTSRLPKQETIGNGIVMFGVALEAAFAFAATRLAARLSDIARADVTAAQERIAELHERAAKAELELERVRAEAIQAQSEAEYEINRLKLAQEPRWVPFSLGLFKFINSLEPKQKSDAEILYEPNDGEAATLASMIHEGLGVRPRNNV